MSNSLASEVVLSVLFVMLYEGRVFVYAYQAPWSSCFIIVSCTKP